MAATNPKYVCITCKTNEVNPMISGVEPRLVNGKLVGSGKSFCSRICQTLWLRQDYQYLSAESLQRIALRMHAETGKRNKQN